MRGFICSLLALECLTTCGHDPRMGAAIEAPFLPFVETWEEQCKCKVLDIPISFGEIDEDHAGECQNYTVVFESYSEIVVDKKWWDGQRTDVKEQLIFHELGHCVLHRGHLRTKKENIPTSLMYPVIAQIPRAYYVENRIKYFDEMFRRGNYEAAHSRKSR